MSAYDANYPPRDPRDRYPEQGDYGSDTRRSRQPRPDHGGAGDRSPGDHLPPPPLGDGLRPAMKRAGSQSRLPSDTKPAFPDEASYLGGRAPDLESKNRPRDRRFRDKRDGYESDEGGQLRSAKPARSGRDDRSGHDRGPDSRGHDSRGPDPRGDPRGPRSRDQGGYRRDEPPARRGSSHDDARTHSRRDRDPYDDAQSSRRRRDQDPYDDDPPRRRRGDRPEIEYGSDPIPARRQSERRPPARRPPPRDYDDYSDDDRDRTRRHRSHDDNSRRPRRDDDRDYHSDRDRRRRDDPYEDRRRRDSSRQRYDDDYDDRRDRDRDRDRRGKGLPKEIKIGNYNVGPLVEKGQKHYATLAPIVTPLVLNYARKYLGDKGGGGGRR